VVYAREIKFCGKVYSAEGVTCDPQFVLSVLKMSEPTTGAQLRTYLASANWLRDAIPLFAQKVALLQEALTAVGRVAPNPRQRGFQSVPLTDVGWGPRHTEAFRALNAAIAGAVARAYPDDEKAVCVYTDASDCHWAGVVTQVPPEDLSLPVGQQRHVPLAFVSGTFDETQRRWPTIEQEGFAIKETCVRCSHLLYRRRGFQIYTDHLNLTHLFGSRVALADGRKQAADRIERWKVIMGSFQYSIHHVAGEDNLFADMLSRWANPDASASSMVDVGVAQLRRVTDAESAPGVERAVMRVLGPSPM